MDVNIRVRRHDNGRTDLPMSHDGEDIGGWGDISHSETLERILQIADYSIKKRKEYKDGCRTTI